MFKRLTIKKPRELNSVLWGLLDSLLVLIGIMLYRYFLTGYNGGIFASQVIRLIGEIDSQTIHFYIFWERPLSYQSGLSSSNFQTTGT
jgi:hypothetical protein